MDHSPIHKRKAMPLTRLNNRRHTRGRPLEILREDSLRRPQQSPHFVLKLHYRFLPSLHAYLYTNGAERKERVASENDITPIVIDLVASDHAKKAGGLVSEPP